MRRSLIPLALCGPLIAITACTPRELALWTDWYQQDPVAATEFANRPEVQAQLQAATSEEQPTAERTGQSGDVWDRLAWCESGGNWGYNGGSGYDGGLQFLPASWRAYGGRDFAEYAWQASREEQIIVAERILDDVGWGAWPACSRKLGLR